MNKKTRCIFFYGIFVSFLLVGCNAKEAVMLNSEVEVRTCENVEKEEISIESEMNTIMADNRNGMEAYIYVYICGEVQNPGVYMVEDTARVYEVLMEAGGYTIKADEEAINLAEFVSDGLKICIPKKNLENSGTELVEKDGIININVASESELEEIPGVGDVKAKAIIAYRIEHGGFTKKEDITMVEGIKTGTYEKIKEYIRVN
jgi:competence protein ComEA